MLTFCNTSFEGSGWSLVGNVCITLNYGKYVPWRGGCSSLDLPKWITDKKASISMIAGDQKCFYWCILCFFNPRKKDKGRVDKELQKIAKEEPTKYTDFTGIEYPVSLEGIDRFQQRNPHLHIVICAVDNKAKRTPVIYDGKEHVNNETTTRIHMIYYQNHYYLVNRLSRLMMKLFYNFLNFLTM